MKHSFLSFVGEQSTVTWEGLVRNVQFDRKLGYVQRVAGALGTATRDGTHEYAMGAFLLAGNQMVTLVESADFE